MTAIDNPQKLALLYHNSSHRGPGKVVQNLIAGLDLVGVDCKLENIRQVDQENVWVGVLQEIPKEHYRYLGHPSVVGPNCFVLPTDCPEFAKAVDHLIVPSQWVMDLYRKFSLMEHCTIDVWPVGIDTALWTDNKRETPKSLSDVRCLVYFKSRSETDLKIVHALLKKCGISNSKVLEYGKYTETELLSSCRWANMGILLTGTESQGIAYMQMLATGLPCFVFDKWFWEDDAKTIKTEATSVPYFDDRCGVICKSVSIQTFKEFVEELLKPNSKFSPGDYIREHFTLEHQALAYYNILAKYNERNQ